MFGKKKNTPLELTKLSSLIAGNMEVMGDVHFQDGLRVDGQIRGNVSPKAGAKCLLILSDMGSIHGNVSAYDAVINGCIVGDLEVTHFLELQPNARVTGNISYHQLRMDCGAAVEGKLNQLSESSLISNVVELPHSTANK